MNILMKWTLLFAALTLFINSGHAWTIGSKGRINGQSVHTTYFLTPNNAPYPVHAIVYAGNVVNDRCVYNAVYDIGVEMLKSGDFVDVSARQLQSAIGMYGCVTIKYINKQIVLESYQLINNGDG
jgi:hypothetical protein